MESPEKCFQLFAVYLPSLEPGMGLQQMNLELNHFACFWVLLSALFSGPNTAHPPNGSFVPADFGLFLAVFHCRERADSADRATQARRPQLPLQLRLIITLRSRSCPRNSSA